MIIIILHYLKVVRIIVSKAMQGHCDAEAFLQPIRYMHNGIVGGSHTQDLAAESKAYT